MEAGQSNLSVTVETAVGIQGSPGNAGREQGKTMKTEQTSNSQEPAAQLDALVGRLFVGRTRRSEPVICRWVDATIGLFDLVQFRSGNRPAKPIRCNCSHDKRFWRSALKEPLTKDFDLSRIQ